MMSFPTRPAGEILTGAEHTRFLLAADLAPRDVRAMGVAAVGQGIPLNMVQRWLGHAQLTTPAIYAEAVGEEECAIAARMWR